MKIIKNKTIVNDDWSVLRLVESDTPESVDVPNGKVIVPLKVWQAQGESLQSRSDIGVWLNSDERAEELQNDIGKFAFIGAGAVVTKNVPDYALLIGNPARQTGWMSEFGHKLQFDNKGFAICPESQEKYKLENGSVTKISLA